MTTRGGRRGLPEKRKKREAAKRGEQDARNRERLAHIRAVRAAAEAEELHRQQGVLRAQHEQQYRDREL